MITLRLDPSLEKLVRETAVREGMSVSAYIRSTLERECALASARKASHRLAPYIGAVCSEEPTDSSRVKEAYRSSIRQKASGWKER